LLGLGDGTFLPPEEIGAGNDPSGLVVGDFTEDGIPDIAVANIGSSEISIFLGKGDGTFEPPVNYYVPGLLGNLVVGDFLGDGHLDLAVNSGPGIVVLPGLGDGTFGTPIWTWTKSFLFAPVAGDFTGDGRLDLAGTDGSSVYFLAGNGDGTFAPEVQVGTQNGQTIWGLVTGDFTGDGHLDIVGPNLVLLGNGDGTFTTVADNGGVEPGAVADFSGDSHLDVAWVPPTNGTTVDLFVGNGDGTFAGPPTVETGTVTSDAIGGDFTSNGIPDVVYYALTNGVPQLYTALGNGDGTFETLSPMTLPGGPISMVTGYFNNDGNLDLAFLVTQGVNEVYVYMGNGDGTFRLSDSLEVPGTLGIELTAGDFTGNGITDLAVSMYYTSSVAVFLGNGDGTFGNAIISQLPAGYPTGIKAADFTRGGPMDLAVQTEDPYGVYIMLGNGDGTFRVGSFAQSSVVNVAEDGLEVADLTGNGIPDVVLMYYPNPVVSVFLGQGNGTLGPEEIVPIGVTMFQRWALQIGDVTGDGIPDLVAVSEPTSTVSVVVGNGDGTFQPPVLIPVGNAPRTPIIEDFTGNGRNDIAITNGYEGGISVFLQGPDGTLEQPPLLSIAGAPDTRSLAVADYNLDGNLGVVAPSAYGNDAAVYLGNGDGTLTEAGTVPLGIQPISVVTADFNGDGRPDFAAINASSDDLTVALGLGDGTIETPVSYPLGVQPTDMVAGDFTGNGFTDLAIATISDQVLILLGRGNGTFEPPIPLAVGSDPVFLLATDFDHDGKLDLLAVNYRSDNISLLAGNGNGTFQPQVLLPAGIAPTSIAVGEFNGDGLTDYAVTNYLSSQVSVYMAEPDGTFRAPIELAVGAQPQSVIAADFTGDGHLDLAVADSATGDISVLLGNGDGTFQPQVVYPAGTYPDFLVAADLNNDGRLDLIAADQIGQPFTVLVGLGDGTFVDPATLVTTVHSTPVVADFTGDGAEDVAVLDEAGQVLLRLGLPGDPGSFGPAIILNPDPQDAARDLAVVNTPAGPILAALDALDSGVTLYGLPPRSTAAVVIGPPSPEPATTLPLVKIGGFAVPGTVPGRLVSGDLDGNGRDDLVVVTAGSEQVFVYMQNPAGSASLFSPEPSYQASVGVSPVDAALVELTGDGRLDIVVSNQFNGDVTVLLNGPVAPFSTEETFAAGTGVRYLGDANGTTVDRSNDGTAGLVAWPLAPGGTGSVVVANSADNSITVLQGTPTGGLLNPQAAMTYATGAGSQPTVLATGDFTADGNLDLAVLDKGTGQITIFLGDGHGGFTQGQTLNAGNQPTGLAVADLNGDGHQDLLVGNQFGDVLVFLGNGDGTFRPYERADATIPLAVADLTGNGQTDFIFADPSLDNVSVEYGNGGQTFSQDRNDGILAPGAVTVADLTGNGIPDLIVANEGSNDVSILLGQGQGASWTMTPGPRLQAGGIAPVSTTVADLTGSAYLDLLVTNSGSNDVTLLPGVGGGFFHDQNPQTFATGVDPVQAFVGNFGGGTSLDLVTINAGSNDLSFFPGFGAGESIASGGVTPIAGVVLPDASGNGLSDLVVANNGDGAFSVFVSGAEGLSLSSVFSQPGVPNPTAPAVSGEGATAQVYTTEAGEESAILLTSFGIPVTSLAAPGGPAPLSNVLLVNGPGLENGLDIVSTSSETAAGFAGLGALATCGESAAAAGLAGEGSGAEEGAAQAATGSTGLGQPSLSSLSALLLGKSPIEDLETAMVTLLTNGTVVIVGAQGPGPAAAEAPPLVRFVSGVDEALEHPPAKAPAGGAAQDAVPAPPMTEVIDRALEDWPGQDRIPSPLPEVDGAGAPAANGKDRQPAVEMLPSRERGAEPLNPSRTRATRSIREKPQAWAGPMSATLLLVGLQGLSVRRTTVNRRCRPCLARRLAPHPDLSPSRK
jgi:large repetitive protein